MGVVHVIPLALETVVPALAARIYHASGIPALIDYIKRVSFVGGAATTIIVSVFSITPHFWLSLTFGESYHEFGNLIRWLAPVYVLAYLGMPVRAALRAIENTAPILAGTALASVLSIALIYPLIDQFGITGAVAATLVVLIAASIVLILGLVQGLRRVAVPESSSGVAVPSCQRVES